MTTPSQAGLALLSAGAAKGLVEALAPRWNGPPWRARFGAVGAMQEALDDGAPCDVLIVTDAMAAALEASGKLRPGSRRPLGSVSTGVAVAAGAAAPSIVDGDALKRALLGASALYFPDGERSTAGAHFVAVLRRLGIHDQVMGRLRMFASGAVAMSALAESGDAAAIGCTQVTEILYTSGVTLAGSLPEGYELKTIYSAGIARDGADVFAAQRFIDLLTGAGSLALRQAGGFEEPTRNFRQEKT